MMPDTHTHVAKPSSGSLGVAVITGASAGIGRIYADRLAGRQYDLILVARRAELLEGVAQSLRSKYHVKVETVAADLSISADLEQVAEMVAQNTRVTMLVNNAGTSTLAPISDTRPAALAAMTDINVSALVRLTRAALPGFKARDHGTIINIGSVLGFHSIAGSSGYSGTKGYVMNFTRGLQDELSGTKIVAQLVLPAATATDLWEISGVPLANLDPEIVMDAEVMVDAALAGLDLGEAVTMPSVEDMSLLSDYDAARMRLLGASQTGKPASRYGARKKNGHLVGDALVDGRPGDRVSI
jgi:short-subunit dehydrogenase